jgi:GNAT superfamily N-acetyltransferase
MQAISTLYCEAAEASDASGIAELFSTAYGRSSHPCKDPGYVRSLLQGSAIWHIAKDDGIVVASMAMLTDPFNRSAQISYGATLPDYRGMGLGTQLAQDCLRIACESRECDLVYGFPRNETMYQILSQVTYPQMQFVGDDGAINVANGRREYHGVICARNPRASFRHVLPPAHSVGASPFVRNAVLAPFGSRASSGDYPRMHVAGLAQAFQFRDGIGFDYDPTCPSAAIEVLSCPEGFRDQEVHRRLMHFLDGFTGVRHSRMTVLADKSEFIAELMSSGFRITAYLPAWLYRDGSRFDCVLMVRSSFAERPAMHGMQDLMEWFRQGYAQATEEYNLLSTR